MKQYRLRKEINHPLGSVKEGVKSIFKGGYYVFPYTGKEFDHNGNGWLGNGFMIQDPSFFSDWFEEVNTVEKERIVVANFNCKGFVEPNMWEYGFISTERWTEEGLSRITKVIEKEFAEPSSKKEERDWEILSFKDVNMGFLFEKGDDGYFRMQPYHGGQQESLLLKNPNLKIYSVLRKSDNTVFTVGDGNIYEKGSIIGKWTIKGFEINNLNDMMVTFKEHNTRYNIDYVSKAPSNTAEDKPLGLTRFITEDGVAIPEKYEGELWRIFTMPSSYEMWKPYNLGMPRWINIGEKYFSTEQAAKEYVILNKPCLSLYDVLKVKNSLKDGTNGHDAKSYLNEKLRELAKSKTNNQ